MTRNEHDATRKARKTYRCDYWLGAAGRCPCEIKPGDRYVIGDPMPDRAGGYGHERHCLSHYTATTTV